MRFYSESQRPWQTLREHERTRRSAAAREVYLIVAVREILDRQKSANALEQIALDVRVDNRIRVEPRALQRRRAAFVSPNCCPVPQHRRAPRPANRLLRRRHSIHVRLVLIRRARGQIGLLAVVVVVHCAGQE